MRTRGAAPLFVQRPHTVASLKREKIDSNQYSKENDHPSLPPLLPPSAPCTPPPNPASPAPTPPPDSAKELQDRYSREQLLRAQTNVTKSARACVKNINIRAVERQILYKFCRLVDPKQQRGRTREGEGGASDANI